MKSFNIQLSSIMAVKEFVNIVNKCPYDIDLSSSRYVVDAKSIMGIFSLDLMNTITLTAHSDDVKDLFERLDKVIVK